MGGLGAVVGRGATFPKRRMVITVDTLYERDDSTYDVVAAYKLKEVFAVVRSRLDERRFTIELKDGTDRTYLSSDRDALLVCVVDRVRVCSYGQRVVVNEVPTPGLRVLPRNAQESSSQGRVGMLPLMFVYTLTLTHFIHV